MMIRLAELEQAINYWRQCKPSEGDELRLSAEVASLAEPYALMIVSRAGEMDESQLSAAARSALHAWRDAERNQNG